MCEEYQTMSKIHISDHDSMLAMANQLIYVPSSLQYGHPTANRKCPWSC